MSSDSVSVALTTPGHLSFSSNRKYSTELSRAGGRVVRHSTGHLVFYGAEGRRFLATDPAGHPLHECEWEQGPGGAVRLLRARFRLDWGCWVGLKPGGLVNEMKLDLTGRPGWERVTTDDLRTMAAQAMRVPLDEVRWFYRDEDLRIDAKGTATIRHRKDAFYLLEDGRFERARFMSCMGAMHWDRIDYLPVVELFKSLLPGTGSAAFELIRGLYDDQHAGSSVPTVLRYRGIPTYPSEAAFRLFSSFFTPQAASGGNPATLFMDQAQAHRITWLPAEDPPVRYFDPAQGICVTVRGAAVQKATCEGDSDGLSYVNPAGRGMVPFDKSLLVREGHLVLKDRSHEVVCKGALPASAATGSAEAGPVSPIDWRAVFGKAIPEIPPREAFGAVLFYPEDDREIDELAAQPFVADYLEDLSEQDREIGAIVARAERILIENGDAVIATCIPFDRPRDVTAFYRRPAFAQRQAQQLWTQCAAVRQWDWLRRIRFVSDQERLSEKPQPVDLVYRWVSYPSFDLSALLMAQAADLRHTLRSQGNGFIVGPARMREVFLRQQMLVRWEEAVENLPTFRMHRTILPRARVKAGLTLFHVTVA